MNPVLCDVPRLALAHAGNLGVISDDNLVVGLATGSVRHTGKK